MPQHTQELPRYADTVIVGGGSSGAVIAGRLAEQTDRFVLLLEAGPDYGSYQAGTWPQSLLDARTIPVGNDWNYASAAHYGKRGLALPRGGCMKSRRLRRRGVRSAKAPSTCTSTR